MARQCRTFEHTADMGLEARADSLGELFEALGEGLAEVVCSREQVASAQRWPLAVSAEDTEAMAVDFLSAVLNVIQTDRFMVRDVVVASAGGNAIVAELRGEPFDPLRHAIAREVKAVTYHQLRIAPEGSQWIGRVVLDV